MFCGWAFQAAEIRCEKNETNTYWNGLNILLTHELNSNETVIHEDSLNEGRFSAFRGYQLPEALAVTLTFELEMKSLALWIPFAFQLNFTDDFLEFFSTQNIWHILSVSMFD